MCVINIHTDTLVNAPNWESYRHNWLIGIKRAKAKGLLGRHPIKINDEALIKFANGDCQRKREIAKETNVSVATLYRRIKDKGFKERGDIHA